MPPSCRLMAVENELERMYLRSHRQHINAVLRDVGHTSILCKLCGQGVQTGFAVVVSSCRDTFHYQCFVDALNAPAGAKTQEMDVDAAGAGGATDAEPGRRVCARTLPPLWCPKCRIPLTGYPAE
mmetsp:Transcript_30338/g.96998  ORF Transcript_30338/g.96998 Transcript_30338/m.96998 type:complete len:125 (+) Transcript_30338:77-451(+)